MSNKIIRCLKGFVLTSIFIFVVAPFSAMISLSDPIPLKDVVYTEMLLLGNSVAIIMLLMGAAIGGLISLLERL